MTMHDHDHPLPLLPERRLDAALDIIRPAMEADGGGIELVAVDDGVVKVRLVGTCLSCPSAALTMTNGVERTLRTRFDWIKAVVRVG